MRIQPIEELLPYADYSVYRLSRMAAKRALELSDGKASLIDDEGIVKVTTISLEEIRAGKVETTTAADTRKRLAELETGE